VSADDLYNEALVRLAQEGAGAGRLEAPSGTASLDSPLCGDRVTVEVRLAGGRIEALAHRVRGCVLCQASASLLGRAAPGLGAAELEGVRQALEALLRDGQAPQPGGPLGGLAVFAPVRAVPSRHACVLLPFDALRAAMAGAKE
jgi:NifU-like protein involved in Fe-S cluster formation